MWKEEIEMIEQTITALNRTVIGAIYIDYPIYLLHLEYKKRDDDPMFYIDWAIAHFMHNQPKLDEMSVSQIMGLDYGLILSRIRLLKDNNLVCENTNGYIITELGKQTFFESLDERPYIDASSDFLIDGRDLTLMPDIFYQDKGYISFDKNSIYPRTILKGTNNPSVCKILNKIEKMSHDRKNSLGLPTHSKDFKSIDTPSQGLLRMYLVFSCDNSNVNYKDLVYEGRVIKIPSMRDIVEKSCFKFKDELVFNYGYYEKSDGDFLRSKVFSFTINEIKNILAKVLAWDEVSERWFDYDKMSSLRPLSVNLTLENFLKSNNRRLLIKNLNRGYVEHGDKEKFIRISMGTTDKELLKLIELDCKIEESKRANNLSDIEEFNTLYGSTYIRKSLIHLDRLDYLEQIDTHKYITEERR